MGKLSPLEEVLSIRLSPKHHRSPILRPIAWCKILEASSLGCCRSGGAAVLIVSHLSPDLLCRLFQLRPGRFRIVRISELEAETIPLESRKNVEMHVEDLLHGGLAVREEEVDPFARQTGRADASGQSLGNPKEMSAGFFRKICKVRRMGIRDD